MDAQNNATEWSEPVAFETIQSDPMDLNMNGIPDDQELLAGEDVDLDDNGISDLKQKDMKSLVTLVGEEYLSLKMSTNCIAIKDLKSVDPDTITNTNNKPAELPLGLIDFKLEVQNPGDFAEVVINLSKPAPAGVKWYIYNETSGWKEYQYATFSPDRTKVTLQLKDGDPNYGDSDGVVNGIIVDPGGIGVGTNLATTPTSGGGGNGTCFIETSNDHHNELFAVMISLLIFIIGFINLRRMS